MEVSPIANQYIGTMRELNGFSKENFDVEIIDHDFAFDHQHESSMEHHSMDGFQSELDKLHGQITDDEMDGEFLRRNIESTLIAADFISEKKVIGKDSDYPSYVESVMEHKPEMVPEEDIRRQRKELEELVASLGYKFDPGDRDAFNLRYTIAPEEMQSAIEQMIGPGMDDIAEATGTDTLDELEQPLITVDDMHDTWQAYFGTTKDRKFEAIFNSSPMLSISRIAARAGVDHELTHWFSSATSKLKIVQGKLNPALGVVLAMSPLYFQEETAARATEEYILAKEAGKDTFATYIYKYMKYSNDVSNNMRILANSGHSRREVVDYAIERLPFEKPEKLKKETDGYFDNLLYKTVFTVDTEAIRLGRRIASLPEKERQAAITRLCAGPLAVSNFLMY